jgi:hypothetical protein
MSKTKTKFELVEYNKADEKKRDNRGKWTAEEESINNEAGLDSGPVGPVHLGGIWSKWAGDTLAPIGQGLSRN